MKRTQYFFIGNLLLTAVFTTIAYWEKSIWIGVAFVIASAVIWGLSQLLEYGFLPGIFFLVFSGLCLVGSFFDLRIFLLFFGITTALNTWDTDRFLRRWRQFLGREANVSIEWRHILRLLLVDLISISLAILGLSIKTQLSFGLMLLVVIIALISLTQLIRLLRFPGSKA